MVAPTSFFGDYGCHVRILEEARALRRLGQAVTVVTYHNGRDVDGLDIRRTWSLPWRASYEVGSSRHKIAFDALLSARSLAVAAHLRPDIVHGHLHEGALIGGTLARLLRRPLVFDFQGSMSAEMVDHRFLDRAGPYYRPVRWLEGRINRLADAIVTSSDHAADLLRAEFRVPAERLHDLPDCVNAAAFRPDLLSADEAAAARSALGIAADRHVVVYLGLLAPYQGTDLLLLAARRVVDVRSDVHFLIMGFPGPQTYVEQAAGLGLLDHVTFPGRVPYEQAPVRLALGELAVAPKMSATEGSGKLLNYMAMGLPTVAFDTPVSREYLRADGVYARRGDAVDLGDRILDVLADPAAARARGLRLRARAVADYDWSRAGERLVALYDRLAPPIGARGPAGGR